MKNIIIYPKTIQQTTGRSTSSHTQQISNPQNLTSNSKNLAFWGVKNPTYYPNYLKKYPDSITSHSGSFYTPETIYGIGFNSDNQIPDEAIIKKITIEYAWEQISYSSTTAYGIFKKPTIVLIKNNDKISQIDGAIPDKYRYNNNKTNINKINTDTAELQTIHSHILYENTNSSYTGKDLKQMKIKFIPKDNTSSNHLRIVMQFLRLNIEYEDNPIFHLSSKISSQKILKNKTFSLDFYLKSTNNQYGITNVKINIPNNLEIINSDFNFDKNTNIWTIDNFEKNNSSYNAKLHIELKGNKIGNYIISGELLNNKDSIINSDKTTQNILILDNEKSLELKSNQKFFKSELNSSLIFTVNFNRTEKIENEDIIEEIIIDTDNLITNNENNWTCNFPIENKITQIDRGIWSFNIKGQTNITISGHKIISEPGDFNIIATHKETNEKDLTKMLNIISVKESFQKDLFKLRLEDGSDVKYNSLVITEGDDLLNPLTYEINDKKNILDYLSIKGETKRVPLNDSNIIYFTLKLNSDKYIEFNNVLASINIYNKETNENENNIIIGCNDQIKIFEVINPKYFSIKSINSENELKIGFIVSSNQEKNCIFKINIFDENKYDTGEWIPSNILFKDYPSIKLSIDGPSELNYETEEETFRLNYIIENKSNISGKNIKFKILHSPYFKINPNDLITIDGYDYESNLINSSFSKKTKIWKFNELSDKDERHILSIPYISTKKGFYDFIIQTFNEEEDFDDDQYTNSYTHNLIVNIQSNINILTNSSNYTPTINELFDYNITIENYIKPQKELRIDIYDIGAYSQDHKKKHFSIENIFCQYGVFKINEDKNNNKLGTWILKNVGKNKKYNLTISLIPNETGLHVINCIFDDKNKIQEYNTKIEVLEKHNSIEFNTYHAVSDIDEDCSNCNNLLEICDDDFIPIGDNFYYVIKIKNNERNSIKNVIIKARLDKSFYGEYLDNKLSNILCSSKEYSFDPSTGLISFIIPEIKACQTEIICFKVNPDKIGEFYSTFICIADNTKILNKQLKMTVGKYFPEKKLEHEINIYNFEKTNRYFRYEIDSQANIFKFFNKGDKSLRTIDIDAHKVSSIETYRGNNLKKIYKDINNKSKYVSADLIRTGNNTLKDEGQLLISDGFIRRFGLLRSEVFHYSGQLPKIGELVDYAMRWDIDEWSTKTWEGFLFTNGVFDLTIDYSKIPSNFDILNNNINPIGTLQSIVNNTKPYGTLGLCYYSNTTNLELETNIDIDMSEIRNTQYLDLKLNKNFGTISWYNRYDDSLFISYDMIDYLLSRINFTLFSSIANIRAKKQSKDIETKIKTTCSFYNITIPKIYIEDCEDIFEKLDNSKNNFDIIENLSDINKYISFDEEIVFNTLKISNNDEDENSLYPLAKLAINKNYIFNFNTNILDNTMFGLSLFSEKNKLNIVRYRNDIEKINGFKLILNNKTISEINFDNIINNYSILLHRISKQNYIINYIFISINSSNYYYYLGQYKDIYQQMNNCNIICTKQKEEIEEKNYIFSSIEKFKEQIPLKFKLKQTNNIIKKQPNKILNIDNNKKWKNLNNIFKNDSYTICKNDSDIDEECSTRKYIQTPKIATKFSNFNIDNFDEITDISLKINAYSNKPNFIDDIKINMFLDGDNNISNNNLSNKKYYAEKISNINQTFNPSIFLIRHGITICNECLSTQLGYYDTCNKCGSNLVTHTKHKINATYCNTCGWIETENNKEWINMVYDTDITYCNSCGEISFGLLDKCPICELPYVTWYQSNTDTIVCKYNNKEEKFSLLKSFNRCSHCLSNDIENIKIDFNRTYCNSCNTLFNDYYHYCPKCFSSNLNYLQYSGDAYTLYDEEHNIDKPIIINTYDKKVKAFSFEIPLNKYTAEINEIDKLNIKIIGNNKNKGQFYYCPVCKNGGIGYPSQCPYCGTDQNEIIHITNLSNIILYGVIKIGDTYEIFNFENGKLNDNFIKEINLLDIVKRNPYENFTITFYIENTSQDLILKEIEKYNFSENIKNQILDSILKTNIEITDILTESHYKNEAEWEINLYGDNRTGAVYSNSFIKNSTDYIEFSNFNIEDNIKNIKNILLHIDGFNNSDSYMVCNIELLTNQSKYIINEYTTVGIFNHKINLLDYISQNEINNKLKIKIKFNNIKSQDIITITNLCLNIEKIKNKNTYPLMKESSISYIKNDNYYLISSLENQLWNLKSNLPNYISGLQLKNNILCMIDFGTLKNNQYIKLYDLELIITYKNKKAEYSTNYIKIGNENNAQLVSGDISKNNGEFFGSIKDREICLNNLETNSIYNEDLKTNFIPLKKEIKQSFISNSETISGITLNTYGKIGYPNDQIQFSIYNDNDNDVGECLFTKKIDGWNFIGEYIIDIDLEIEKEKKYWIVLNDISADNNNYYRLKYNLNKEVGQLRIKNNKEQKIEDFVLSFAIHNDIHITNYFDLPKDFCLDEGSFKINHILYSYNIVRNNNIFIKNLKIKQGVQNYDEN